MFFECLFVQWSSLEATEDFLKSELFLLGIESGQLKPLLFPAWVWNSCDVSIQGNEDENISFAFW